MSPDTALDANTALDAWIAGFITNFTAEVGAIEITMVNNREWAPIDLKTYRILGQILHLRDHILDEES